MELNGELAVNGQLYSPPDSTNVPKQDASESELSDLEDHEDKDESDFGEIEPAHWADDGHVPVFKPTYDQFKDFTVYMNRINHYGMQSGIVKVIPPEGWKAELPNLDEAIKTIRVKEPIKQDIMGTNGTYRQANILHQRSYNLPQWRALCEQSEHQPPAKRGERRAHADKNTRVTPRTRNSTPITNAPVVKRRPGRPRKVQVKIADDDDNESLNDRLPTPISPKFEEDTEHIKQEPLDKEDTPVRARGRQPKATSISARRKNNRRDAAGRVDEKAFKNFEYRVDGSEYTPERCEELERAYWKTLTYAPPLYGADMPGTLFDERTKAWNLGKLPNLLDVLGTKIPGVNTAYLYLGMWKATFAWHLEDVDLYSINYNHFGAPKQWYSIPQGSARKFEEAMKQVFPQDAKACDQFLRHKTFLISPSHLLQNYGIRVNKIVHHPGEFVVTYPYGYHSGYNLGYNCAEAVNFALESWLVHGRIAKRCECEQAQDSVWIDVQEIERKLRGEKTPEYYEVTDDEDEDDEDEEEDVGPIDLPTPPNSGAEAVKPKTVRSRKRKRAANDKDEKFKVKKVRRVNKIGKQPCCLCPNDFPSEPLLPTDNGKKAHRRCALYIPETEIVNESGLGDIVINVARIPKARMELKCGECALAIGACFQCDHKKCARPYHATCAASAGVFVEEGDTPVYGEDGTEYKIPDIQFICRFHRAKRDKRLSSKDLEKDKNIKEVALQLKKGDLCQFQSVGSKSWFAGPLVENRMDEGMLLVDILPHGTRIEIEYKYLMLPQASDYRIIKPSPNALPMPKSHSFATSKRQTDDTPRPDDKFGDSEIYTWKEFVEGEQPNNPAQVKVDLSKENQIWYYLGKKSTEAKAQFTEDIVNKPRFNPKGHFLETLPKPTYAAAISTPRQSYPASHPNQTAMNAARTRPLQQSMSVPRPEKPYMYKPRVPADTPFTVDSQALQQQRNYVSSALRDGSSISPQSWRPPLNGANFTPPSVRDSHSTGSTVPRTMPYSPFAGRTAYGSSGSGRPSSSKPRHNPFAKYAYLQLEHNKSPLAYKSPYKPEGGFMNGYQGNLMKYIQSTPNALSKYTSDGQSSSSSLINGVNIKMNSLPPPRTPYNRIPEISPHSPYSNPNMGAYGALPSVSRHTGLPSPPVPSRSSISSSTTHHCGGYAQQNAMLQQPSLPPPTGTNSNVSNSWERKDATMHPAIRREYMFHNQYQPSPTSQAQTLPQSKVDYQSYQAPQFPNAKQSEHPFQDAQKPDVPVQQRNPYPSNSPTPIRQQEYHPATAPSHHESPAPKPVYPHQQYFQRQQSYDVSFPSPDVTRQAQPQHVGLPQFSLPEVTKQPQHQQATLPRLPPPIAQMQAPIMHVPGETFAKIAECPPDVTTCVSQMMANLRKAAL